MPEKLISVDLSKSPLENENIHNRWHPDIPMACWVKPGDEFVLETFDWTGGFIQNNDSADDVRDIDLSTVHYLSGPVGVKGAEPGDLLVVDLLDIGAKQDSLWGFNGFFSKKNGGGFLTEHFPEAQKSIWDIHGMFTKSRHVPGVSYAGLIHPGLIGCLPDKKMLEMWNTREQALIDTNPTGSLANPPFAGTAHMGKLKGEAKAKAAAEGARTVPPREHGGNCDIKDLSRGSKVFFPVYVDGAGPLGGRPALQPGRRRDHLLRRHRDGRLGAHEGHPDQGRHGQVRHQEPDLQAQPDHPDLQRLPDLRRHLGRRAGQAAVPGRQRGLPPGLPERDRVPQEVRLLGRPGLFHPRHGAGAGPHQRRGRRAQRLRDALAADQIFEFDINPNAAGPIKHMDGSVVMPLSPDLA
jgi:formamidase